MNEPYIAAGDAPEIFPPGTDVSNPYCRDDYPRQGCRFMCDVQEAVIAVSIFAPNGAWIESTHANNPAELAEMVRRWLRGEVARPKGGFKPPIQDHE